MIKKNRYLIFVSALLIPMSITYYQANQVTANGNRSAQMISQKATEGPVNASFPDSAKWTLDSEGTLTITGKVLVGGDYGNLYPGLVRQDVKKIVIAGPIAGGENLNHMFEGFSKVTKIEGLHHLNTSETMEMVSTFFGLTSLKTLDVSKLNTGKVTNMISMFDNDIALTSLDLSNFNTSRVTTMNSMFLYDKSLTTLDLSSFDTSSVADMTYMFYGDTNLESLDLSNFKTAQVTSRYQTFTGASNLWQLKLGNGVTQPFLSSLPAHSDESQIPSSQPPRNATGPGWLAVDEEMGGTIDNPQGKTVYDGTFMNWTAPLTAETYVWQQASSPVAKQTITVETVDAQTQRPIPGTVSQQLSAYPTKTYDVSDAKYHPAIKGYTWNGKMPANVRGQYRNGVVVKYVYLKDTASGGSSNGAGQTPGNGGETGSSSGSSQNGRPIINNGGNTSVSKVATKGEVIYATKKIGLYRSTRFSKVTRRAWYVKKPRIHRPMFAVIGYQRSTTGVLRYRVRDINHTSKTDGQTGYVTASWRYVRPAYYLTKHATITVINPRGVHAYRKANLTGKVGSYHQGKVLHVKKLVSHHLTTRFLLTNGRYITANRKLVNMGRHRQPKSIRTKHAINLYRDVNLAKKKRAVAKNVRLKVDGYDYSRSRNLKKHGTLRYRVAGGYVTGNPKYISANY